MSMMRAKFPTRFIGGQEKAPREIVASENPFDFGDKYSVPAVVVNGRAVRLDGKPRWSDKFDKPPADMK